MADIKQAYAASSDLTVTNLAGIASSSTWVAGWSSAVIDNTSNLYLDYRVTAKITVESAGLTAGEIRMYLLGMLDDTNWPDVYSSGTEGTEGTAAIHDVEVRDAVFRLAALSVTDTTASRVYPLDCPSVAAVFNYNLPAKFLVFITHSTVAALETSGHQVTIKGSYRTG